MAKNYTLQNKNLPSKNRKAPGKVKTFFQNHKKVALLSLLGLGVAALITVIVIAVNSLIPYNIRLKNYIDVPQYMGITIKNETLNKEIERQKRNLLLKYATYETLTEGVIEEGYKVTIDAKGYLLKDDGTREEKSMDSGSLTNYEITDIGNHYTDSGTAFSSEIQTAVIGKDIKSPGEIVAKITYPETYTTEALRGRSAEFDITVKKVEKTLLPNYTNTFVLAKTGYKDIAEYEAALEQNTRYNLVWNTVVNSVTVKKFPENKVTEHRKAFAEPYNDYMEKNNISFDELIKELEIDKETYFKEMDTYAYGVVREEMILYYIARESNIKVSDSEYKVLALELAVQNGYSTISEFENKISKATVERNVLWQKVKTILVANAVFE